MVKDSKMFIDPSDFSEPESALDLYSNSIRSSLAFKGALSEPTYVAKVLSPPLPLNPAQAGVFNEPAAVLGLEANEPKTWRQKASEAALSALGAAPLASPALSKFTFYGRIEKIHGGLLREPCPITYAAEPAAAYQLIRQHTQFISAADTTEFPSVGDLVNVRLEPGTAGKWNLQYGMYIGIRDRSSVTPPHLTPSAKDGFKNNGSITTMGDATRTYPFAGGVSIPDNGPGPTTKAEEIHAAYPLCSIELAEEIIAVSGRLGIPDAGWLANLINFESGQTFSPTAKGAVLNKAGDTAVGLIQFIPKTARGLGTSSEALLKMTALQQMKYVEKYLATYKGKLLTPPDLNMAVYFPTAIGQGPNYSIYDYYVRKGNKLYGPASGKAYADRVYLKPNGGIKTAGNYTKLMLKYAKLPTGMA